jgi:hypothetical protein
MAETTTQKLSRNKINRAPTNELGAVLGGAFSPAGMAPWTRYVDDSEYVPELMWPKSVEVFEKMSTDTQLAALYAGTVLPIRHFNWQLDPNNAPDDIVQKLAADYNLPIEGESNKDQPQRRTKKRFSFRNHLRKALYAGKYGHYFFEQVGEVTDPSKGGDGLWHLRKLAERPPKTIQNILVAPDGGLVSIGQNVSQGMSMNRSFGQLPEIPVDRLVAYVWEQEGGDWVGRSWFRECYRNWLIKDRLMRIDATNHEKAGGIIYGVAPQGATPAEQRKIQEMSSDARVGMTSGMGLPAGTDLNILRAAGTDVVASMRYHDESMARRFLLMVMQLGQTTTGSRALGTTFVDFFGQGLTAIADWFVDTFCEHVIEDDVDWNWGEDVEIVPRLKYEFDPELAATDLVNMIDSGLILVDDELETEVRKEMGLPEKGTPRAKNPVPDPIAIDPNPPAPSPTQAPPAPGVKAERQTGGEAPSSPPSGVKRAKRFKLGRRNK